MQHQKKKKRGELDKSHIRNVRQQLETEQLLLTACSLLGCCCCFCCFSIRTVQYGCKRVAMPKQMASTASHASNRCNWRSWAYAIATRCCCYYAVAFEMLQVRQQIFHCACATVYLKWSDEFADTARNFLNSGIQFFILRVKRSQLNHNLLSI